MKKEIEIFEEFVSRRNLRQTLQRRKIIDIFLSTEKHVSADELYKLVKKKDPSIGYTTVYRTMKLLLECGLCEEADFGDGILRYEHKYAHKHHDHLVCTKCGKFTEVHDEGIELMQERLAKKHKFMPTKHKLQIFGICKRCIMSSREKV